MKIRYLGTTGFVIQGENRTLVLDPYVTRPGLFEFFCRPVKTNESLVDELIPHADDVLIGHSHIDHILDTPYLCQRTGARLIGSSSACQVGRAAGLPESQLLATTGRETIESGPARITAFASAHGKMFGKIPLPGEITEPPPWPPRTNDLLCGQVLDWHIEIEGRAIVYIDSADFLEEQLEGISADVVCLCAVGRKWRPNYVTDLVELLNPGTIIPCHWDWLFSTWHKGAKNFPGINLDGFVREIEAAGSQAAVLQFGESLEL